MSTESEAIRLVVEIQYTPIGDWNAVTGRVSKATLHVAAREACLECVQLAGIEAYFQAIADGADSSRATKAKVARQQKVRAAMGYAYP